MPQVDVTIKPCETPDGRIYNLPTVDELAVVIPMDDDGAPAKESPMRTMRLTLRNSPGDSKKFSFIDRKHPMYDSLHYVLLFPYGDLGWSISMTYNGTRITAADYYCTVYFSEKGNYTCLEEVDFFNNMLLTGTPK